MIGTAAAGSTVKIYSTGDCSGSPLATGTDAAFAAPGITVAVDDDTTTNFRATATDSAGNASPCSNARTYVEDTVAPETSITSDPKQGSSTRDTPPTFSF